MPIDITIPRILGQKWLFDILPIVLIDVFCKTPITIRRKEMAVKTTKVTLKDGRDGRGVKVTAKNLGDVGLWIKDTKTEPEIFDPWGHSKLGPRIQVHTKAGLRRARVGDVIVKLDKGDYIVIKADDFSNLVKI